MLVHQRVITEATAFKSKITTVPLLCDGFRPMDESLEATLYIDMFAAIGYIYIYIIDRLQTPQAARN